jgi:hypothetical protein
MGKVLDFGYRSPHSQKLNGLVIQKPPAPKAPSTEPAPTLPVERAAVKVRKAAAAVPVVTNAVQQAPPVLAKRWLLHVSNAYSATRAASW